MALGGIVGHTKRHILGFNDMTGLVVQPSCCLCEDELVSCFSAGVA